MAKETVGFSGADLANLVNEAAILAARQGQKTIEMKEMEESIDKVSMGPERRSKRMSLKDKELTAYHEAGMRWWQKCYLMLTHLTRFQSLPVA